MNSFQDGHSAYGQFRQAAANRIVPTHDGLVDARTRNLQALATTTKDWVTLAEAARELSVQSERLADCVDDGRINAVVREWAEG